MAIDAATTLSDFSGFLNPEQAAPIFEKARLTSVVQQLARQIPLSINGEAIPVFTEKPQASWVGEAAQKPTTAGAVALRYMRPHKLAAILVVSAEVVRANPANYVSVMRGDLAEAFGNAFDAAALHGTNTPFTETINGTTYPNYVDATALAPVNLNGHAAADGGTYASIVDGLELLVDASKKLTGFAWDDKAEPILLSSVDTTGRPLWIAAPPIDETVTNVQRGMVIGRPSRMEENVGLDTPEPAIVGYGGDWTEAAWGVVGGITYDVSTETSVTINGVLTSLWEYNLVAVRAEAEYGFVINDKDAFVKYVDGAAPGA